MVWRFPRQPKVSSLSFTTLAMNRPRNRQPQSQQQRDRTSRGGPPRTSTNVPTTRQVVPGAAVSVVLKADQPTGREVQGIVKDLLTRGDHPRGIKVRLQDGRIGRVQRMADTRTTSANPLTTSIAVPRGDINDNSRAATAREPLPHTLADFMPRISGSTNESNALKNKVEFSSATVKCPFCNAFEGDEAAVSHHISQHLT